MRSFCPLMFVLHKMSLSLNSTEIIAKTYLKSPVFLPEGISSEQ